MTLEIKIREERTGKTIDRWIFYLDYGYGFHTGLTIRTLDEMKKLGRVLLDKASEIEKEVK